MDNRISCDDCHQKIVSTANTPGYGQYENKRICFACCAVRDRARMIETGKATLYLTAPGADRDMGVRTGKDIRAGRVTNWPGTLEFRVNSGCMKTSRHNIAGKRYDIWFAGPDNTTWHGVQYGDNTQLCRCKRTKS